MISLSVRSAVGGSHAIGHCASTRCSFLSRRFQSGDIYHSDLKSLLSCFTLFYDESTNATRERCLFRGVATLLSRHDPSPRFVVTLLLYASYDVCTTYIHMYIHVHDIHTAIRRCRQLAVNGNRESWSVVSLGSYLSVVASFIACISFYVHTYTAPVSYFID